MAVAKRGPGHCLVLCWGLLLLSVCAHAARDSLQGAGSDTKSSKRPPHARPPPPPSSDQGARPVLTAAKSKLQKLPTVAAMVVGASADAAAKAQQTDSERREQLVGAGTDAEQQQQQATDPGLLEMGAVGVATEPFQQPQALQNKPFPAGGAKGAQREPHQQPKALHDEQFPGNGAQGDHQEPEKQLQATRVQAQQPKGLKDAGQLPEKQRQAASFEVIGGQSSQDPDQLSATLKRLEGFKSHKEATEQEIKAVEMLEDVETEADIIERTRIRPLQGVSAMLKALKERWALQKAQLLRAQEREARRLERLQQVSLRVKAKEKRVERRKSRQAAISAKEEAKKELEKKAEEAREKAADFAKQDKDTKKDKVVLEKGLGMLDAAIALESTLQGPKMQEFFRSVRTVGRAENEKFTRGILISTGGTTLLNHAYATLTVLRNTLNCTLPVEIVYNGEYEMDNRTCEKFGTDFQDVRCVDASKFDWYPDHHRAVSLKKEEAAAKGSKADKEGSKDTSGFQFKVFSLCYITSFDEVLMLDSDNLPLRDPEALFDSAEYQRSGTLFFSDWWDIVEWVKPQAYKAFGLPYPGDNPALLAAESGQLLLNRNRHADALEWLWFLNSHSEVIYKLMYGDKDTFRLAFALAGKSDYFEQVSIPPSCPLDASETNAEPVTYLHAGMVQHDPSGNPAFLHRTAEGKVYPFNHGYRKAHYLTVPLSSRRAAGVLGHDFKKMGLQRDQIDHVTYGNCSHPQPQTFHAACGVSLKSGAYPVPVIPVSEIADLAPVLEASYAVHDRLQHAFHTTFVVG